MSKSAASSDEQYRPSLRLCDVKRPLKGSCGFHLSRTQWDPYPWVSGVEDGSEAQRAGLIPGDCVLEVNGEDVLGQRIGQVAHKVREKRHVVTLLLWNAGSSPYAAVQNMSGSSPTPLSLQRLSSCFQNVLQLLECPVCLEAVPPPASQCCNGHILCARCRARADKCPVCRVPLGPRGRCLLADKLHVLLSGTFNDYRPPQLQNVVQPQPAHRPLIQIKSRLLLTNQKASSVENISLSEDHPIRARSLSTGQIAANHDLNSNKRTLSFNCPYGFECSVVVASNKLMTHLQEDHEGPLIQYFMKSSSISLRLPTSSSTSLISLTTQEGTTFYVKVMDHSFVWLWMIGDMSQASGHRLKVTTNRGSVHAGSVFSLATPWHDVVRNTQCVKMDLSRDDNEVTLEVVS